jgi:hypothetical protein
MDFKKWFEKPKLPTIRILIKLTLENPQDTDVVEQLYLSFSQAGMQKFEKNNLIKRNEKFAMFKNSAHYDWELIADQKLDKKDDLTHVDFALKNSVPTSDQLSKCLQLLGLLKKSIDYYYRQEQIMKSELITYYTSDTDEVRVVDYKNYPYEPETKGDDDDGNWGDWGRGGDRDGPKLPPEPRPGGLSKQPIYSLTAGEITQGRIMKE